VTFNQADSVFAGMSQPQLQHALNEAQRALIKLQIGERAVTVTYSQGEGTRHVQYKSTNPGALVQLINELKACLGLAPVARRGFRVSF